MNSIVAKMMGTDIQEDQSVPVPATKAAISRRSRADRRHRTTAAMMLGLGESDDDESIIPDDAEPVEGISAPSGIKIDQQKVNQDKKAEEPRFPDYAGKYFQKELSKGGEELLTPRDALVAPDITPQAFEPIDPSEVPAPKTLHAAPTLRPAAPEEPSVNPMDVLLGRASSARPRQAIPEEPVVTAEAAQAAVNATLNIGGGGAEVLKQGQAMPDPVPAQPSKIMEAFDKYGPKRGWLNVS